MPYPLFYYQKFICLYKGIDFYTLYSLLGTFLLLWLDRLTNPAFTKFSDFVLLIMFQMTSRSPTRLLPAVVVAILSGDTPQKSLAL